jgi:hypothetical protein
MIAVDAAPISETCGHNLLPRKRRDSERLIDYWEHKAAKLGTIPTLAALDLDKINTAEWSHRFVVKVDPIVGNSSLLMYGKDFARLLDLPWTLIPHVPLIDQVPKHFFKAFAQGVREAHKHNAPILVEDEVRREDGFKALYRAAFVPVVGKADSRPHLVFGTFDSWLVQS